MVAIVANVPTSRENIDFFQAFDEDKWFLNASVWCRQAMTPEQIPVITDEAIRQAYARKGPAVIILPKDYGWTKIEDNYKTSYNAHVPANFAGPKKESVEEAVKLIKEAKNPVVYFGNGAREADAGEELKEFSNKFKMPLLSSYLGKGVIEDEFPAYVGTIGRIGAKTPNEIQSYADLVVWVGNNSPFSVLWFNKDTKVIQIDVDPGKLGKRHTVDVPILADAKKTLRALIDAGEDRPESPIYKAAIADRENWDAWHESFIDSDEMPVRPEPIWDVINKEAADDAIFAIDVGNVNVDHCRLLKMHDDQKWTTSGLHATMGYGAPAALTAATVYPDREVWQLAGDGGFAMMNQELLTMARYNMHVLNIVFTNECEVIATPGKIGTPVEKSENDNKNYVFDSYQHILSVPIEEDNCYEDVKEYPYHEGYEVVGMDTVSWGELYPINSKEVLLYVNTCPVEVKNYILEDDKIKSTEFGRPISLENENNRGRQKVKYKLIDDVKFF